ncbi:MAG TPA: PQQ-binding-like beta-propeller repeat protein [Ktedonobacteraceae bacterium]|nr:PQQ-binding-like beta-propeller repeat protein [Ktedonobacteraceae bacterium]
MVPVFRLKGVPGVALLLMCLIGMTLLSSPRPVAHASGGSPSITLSPAYGPPTTKVTVKGTGFGSQEQIVITIDNEPAGKSKTNQQGDFTAKITIPKNYGPGVTPVQATGQSSGLSAQANFFINTDWPSIGFDAQNSRDNIYENVLSPSDVQFLVLNWSYTQGIKDANATSEVNGVLYVSGYGNLQALDAQTGKFIWKSNIRVLATAVANGVVYGTSDDGQLYALDAQTGTLIWSFSTGFTYDPTPVPVVANGIVYFGEDGMYALNAQTGALIWKYSAGEVLGAPAIANGVVYFGDDGMYALDAQTGALIWEFTPGGLVQSTASVVNGVVYFGTRDQDVYALNAQTGTLIWKFSTGGIILSTPAVANGTVYIGSRDKHLYALDAQTGALIWAYKVIGDVVTGSPVVANGVVYVGSTRSEYTSNPQVNLFALDAKKGTQLWTYSRRGFGLSNPIVANGFFYVGINGVMYAFSLPGLKQ